MNIIVKKVVNDKYVIWNQKSFWTYQSKKIFSINQNLKKNINSRTF